MLPHATYKVLHLLGIFVLFGGLGGLWALAGRDPSRGNPARRLLMASHGVALLIILFAGFGMLARLGIMGAWPPWVWIKITLWVLIGALPALLNRAGRPRALIFYLAPLLGAVAAYAAIFRLGDIP